MGDWRFIYSRTRFRWAFLPFWRLPQGFRVRWRLALHPVSADDGFVRLQAGRTACGQRAPCLAALVRFDTGRTAVLGVSGVIVSVPVTSLTRFQRLLTARRFLRFLQRRHPRLIRFGIVVRRILRDVVRRRRLGRGQTGLASFPGGLVTFWEGAPSVPGQRPWGLRGIPDCGRLLAGVDVGSDVTGVVRRQPSMSPW